MRRSMSRRATRTDSAMVEAYVHTMKAEAVQRKTYDTDYEAVAEVIEYTRFYLGSE
jgi:transposase InsO family protein